jgi:uncharacterized membrane protein
MIVAAVVLSFATVAIDKAVDSGSVAPDLIYAGGPEGARALLATIAGSMITVAGVSFSITIAALALASSQFGPRLLRNFMRDTGNQIVLGTFISAFMYCLLVLRTVRSVQEDEFVPHISVTIGILTAVAGLIVLIYFIHHVSESIQAATIIAGVGRDLDRAIARLFPREVGRGVSDVEGGQEKVEQALNAPGAETVVALHSGYVQLVNLDSLMALAREKDLVIGVACHPGNFVARGGQIARVWCREPADADCLERVSEAFAIGDRPTAEQDVEYSIDQLVEIAVRALSPGINDPFTAIACIDRLGASLRRLAELEFPSPYRFDSEGRLRLIAPPVRFEGILDAAFNQIRQYGRTSAAVTIHLLENIALVAEAARTEERRGWLLRHAMMVERGSRDGMGEAEDWKDVDERYRSVIEALEKGKKPA